jgi:hypothetical protein
MLNVGRTQVFDWAMQGHRQQRQPNPYFQAIMRRRGEGFPVRILGMRSTILQIVLCAVVKCGEWTR